MAPHMKDETRNAILNAIVRGESTPSISTSLGIPEHKINRIRYNLRKFGSTKEPSAGKKRGPKSKVDPVLEERLLEHLHDHPGTYAGAMKGLVKEEFGIEVSASTLRRVVKKRKVGLFFLSWIAANCSRGAWTSLVIGVEEILQFETPNMILPWCCPSVEEYGGPINPDHSQ